MNGEEKTFIAEMKVIRLTNWFRIYMMSCDAFNHEYPVNPVKKDSRVNRDGD